MADHPFATRGVLSTLLLSLSAAAALGQPVAVDAFGDPLPEGAVARLGTVRFRHAGNVHSVAWSPDGKVLASAADCGTVALWEPSTGKRLKGWQVFECATFVRWTSDGKVLVTAGFDGEKKDRSLVRTWDAATGKKLLEVPAQGEYWRRSVGVASDGRGLAVSPGPNVVERLDLTTGKSLREYREEGDREFANVVAFGPDGELLAAGGFDGIRVWDAATGKLLFDRPHRNPTFALRFSPDGKRLAAATRAVTLLDADTGKEIWSQNQQPVTGEALAFSPDGKTLVCGWHPLQLVDAATGKEIRTLDLGPGGNAHAAAFSPDGKSVAVARAGGQVQVWDAAAGKLLSPDVAPAGWIEAAEFSPDGKKLATRGPHEPPRLWDVPGRRLSRTVVREGLLFSLSWLPDGKSFAAWDGKSVTVCREDGTEVHKFAAPDGRIGETALSPDGRLAAELLGAGKVTIWDVVGGAEGRELSVDKFDTIGSLGFSGDGRLLAVGSSESLKVGLWDIASGKLARTIDLPPSHPKVPNGVPQGCGPLRFLADGRRFAVYGGGVISLWDVDGNAHGDFAEDGGAGPFAMSPDGRLLALVAGREVRLLETASGLERRRLAGHEGQVDAVGFSADGRLIATGGCDTTVLLWPSLPSAAKPRAADLDGLWRDLASADATKADKAVAALSAAPELTLPFLRDRLRPPDEDRVKRSLKNLDADDFATRTAAAAELEKDGLLAEPALRRALEGKPTPEARAALERLLDKLRTPTKSLAVLRSFRALETLDQIGTDASGLLRDLKRAAPGTRLEREADVALKRLSP